MICILIATFINIAPKHNQSSHGTLQCKSKSSHGITLQMKWIVDDKPDLQVLACYWNGDIAWLAVSSSHAVGQG